MPTSATRFDDATVPGEGFELRALTDDDTEPIFKACQDQLTQRWLPLPLPYTREVAAGFVNTFAPQALASGGGIVRAISIDGTLCGVIDFKKTDWRSGVSEIGYWLAPWARGNGLAGRASRALADWGLTDQGLARIVIHAATGNVASQKAAIAAGFTQEGVARSAGFTHGGRVDLVVFGKIRADL